MLPSIFQEVKDLAIHPNYKRPKIGAGELKTPVSFFQFIPGEGPEPGEIVKKELHSCKAQIYNPSMKDMEILNAKGTKEGLTIKSVIHTKTISLATNIKLLLTTIELYQ